MKTDQDNEYIQHYVEFSPEKDVFIKARQKSVRSWILAHLFYKNNKYLITIVFISTIVATNLSSLILVILGLAITDFLKGDQSNFSFYIILILKL